MRVQLVVSDDCEPCRLAETIWHAACRDHDATLEIVDIASRAGVALGESLDLRTLPAVLIDDRLVAVGVQSRLQVDAFLKPTVSATTKP